MTPYLTKHSLFPRLIEQPPSPNLGMVVVIPCYHEKALLESLESLKNCDRPTCDVEVIVVINDSEVDDDLVKKQNQITLKEGLEWAAQNASNHLQFHILYKTNLRKKIAGVGTARKIGMDEAVRRLEAVGNSTGIICCFDADSWCTTTYFRAIENHFLQHPKTQACGIYYEHPLAGEEFSPETYEAIAKYELHLRYYVHAQRSAGFPHAEQTIGASMAVRCNAYQQQGGMNKRKAGEDFYFLHKFIALDAFSNLPFRQTEIPGAKVIPSPRLSNRVPFGTGKAVGEILAEERKYLTYHPQIFEDLQPFLENVNELFFLKKKNVDSLLENLPNSISHFLKENNFSAKLFEIQSNTTNADNFRKRFFKWFNAFLMMKYVHFARDHFHPSIPVEDAAISLLEKIKGRSFSGKNAKELLVEFREMDR